MAGNYLDAINSREARIVDNFIPDSVRPQLLSFVADMVGILFCFLLYLFVDVKKISFFIIIFSNDYFPIFLYYVEFEFGCEDHFDVFRTRSCELTCFDERKCHVAEQILQVKIY